MSENESTHVDEVYTFSLSTKTCKDQPLFKIKVHGTPITVMADSGESINILDEKEYDKLPNRPSLELSSVKIYGYQSKVPLRVLGKFCTALASKTRNFNNRLYVVERSGGSLLSWKASQELNLLQTVQQVTSLPSQPEAKAPADLLEYDDLFHGLGLDGISPDPKKVEDVVSLQTPSTASEVRSLLGMTNYCSRFIQDYTTKTEPLRKLTHKDQPWCWTAEHDHSVSQLKEALVSAPVTAYFDPEKSTEISVDASPVGLMAIVSQVDQNTKEKHVITYASRSLTATKQRYS